MSSTTIRQWLAFAVVLTTSGVASARRPPSLAMLEQRTERILATCPSAPSTSGYRDMLTRFGPKDVASSTSSVAAVQVRVGNHLVLRCAGGDVREAGGYRDMLVRFRHDNADTQTAAR